MGCGPGTTVAAKMRNFFEKYQDCVPFGRYFETTDKQFESPTAYLLKWKPVPSGSLRPGIGSDYRPDKVTKSAVELDGRAPLHIIIAFAFRSSSVGRAGGC